MDRFRKNGSFGHVRADLFGAKDASQKGRRRCKKPGPKRKWTKLFEKEVRKEACSTYAFKTEQQLAGIYRCSKAHIHRTLTGRAIEAGEKSCTVRKTESHTVEKNMPRIIEMGHSCYEVLRHIKGHQLAWMDEFGVKYSVGHNCDHARTRSGEPAFSEQTYRQKNAHVAIAISPDGVLKVGASDKPFSGAAAYAFLCELQPRIASMPYVGGQAVHLMSKRLEGVQFMGMDKLGRSGRAKEPTAGHYDARIFECFKSVGIRAFQLPPKGCLFNVVEVVNHWAQQFCERWTPEDHGRDDEFPNHGRGAQGRQYTPGLKTSLRSSPHSRIGSRVCAKWRTTRTRRGG